MDGHAVKTAGRSDKPGRSEERIAVDGLLANLHDHLFDERARTPNKDPSLENVMWLCALREQWATVCITKSVAQW